jgi:hypothetical protein
MAIKDVILAMEEIGFTSVILPFVIIFTVVFAVLQKSRVLGADSKGNPKANYNAMVAFIIAFFALIMFKTLSVMNYFIRYVAVLLFIFIILGIVLSFIGGHVHMSGAIKSIALGLILIVLLEALVMGGMIPEDIAYRVIMPLLVALLIAAGLIAMMTSGKGEKKKQEKKSEEKVEKKQEKRPESKGKKVIGPELPESEMTELLRQ